MKVDPLKFSALTDTEYSLLFKAVDLVYSGDEQSVPQDMYAAFFRLLRKCGVAVKSFNDVKSAAVTLYGLKYTIECLRSY